jgi:archaellum biogenesis ATPase FlaH
MIEKTILTGLMYNETYMRRVIPFLKSDYFSDAPLKTIFNLINEHIDKYNRLPDREVLRISLERLNGISDGEYIGVGNLINELEPPPATQQEQWMIDETERFCQDKAIHLALRQSIEILDDSKTLLKTAIPKLLQDALAVSFDTAVGHDYSDNAMSRYEFYQKVEDRIPFELEMFNLITKGGLPRKTLNIILAGTGVGKTLFMCNCAASNYMLGKNVLYITMEMAEERIAERIDAKLLGVTIDELNAMSRDVFQKKIDRVKSKTNGRLIIKEYPTATASAQHIRNLLNELKLKKNFIPDIIYIDYLNICCSSRIKQGGSVNSYTYIKSIAEELRGLAVEYNVPIVSATQTTRSGFTNSDLGLEDTSESFGLPATADFMFALITSEEIEELGQIMVKQLKNRYGDPGWWRKFVIGIDKAKMTLYNVEQDAHDQNLLQEDIPVFDNSASGTKINDREKFSRLSFD